MSPVMKSPSETSRATVAPPATGFGGPASGTEWFSATHSAFSENPRDPGDSQQPWKCPHRPENLAEQALLLLKLSEGVALLVCRKPFRVTIHPPGDPPPTHGAGRLLPKLLLGMQDPLQIPASEMAVGYTHIRGGWWRAGRPGAGWLQPVVALRKRAILQISKISQK